MTVAPHNIEKRNEAVAKYGDKKRTPKKFALKDKVWLSTKKLSLEEGFVNRKFLPRYCGPFTIIEKLNKVTLKLDLLQDMLDRRVHNTFVNSLLRPHVQEKFGRTVEPPPPVQLENQEE